MAFPTKKIEDFCRTGSGGTPSRSKSEYFDGGTIPWVKSGELKARFVISTEESITDAAVEQSAVKLVPKGALLVAMYGATVGEVSELTMDATTNQAICHIIPDPNVCDRGYLFQYLSAIKPELLDRRVGGGQPNISQTIIKSVNVPLPPLPEQRRIAAILDKADALRAKRREAIAKLDQLLQSVFLEMFGNPVANPKGWPKQSLISICNHITDCPHSTPKWADKGVICLRTPNLLKGSWCWDDTRYVTPEEYAERTKRNEISAGDIILSREGTVGIAAIVEEGMKLCMGQRLVQVCADKTRILPGFLLHLLLYDLAPERISRLMVGSTAKHLNVKDLKGLRILLPPMALQEQFVNFSHSLTLARERVVKSDISLQNLLNSLLHDAFESHPT